LFFTSLGAFTSQLALTRGRAITYGLIPLVVLYVIRGAANSVSDADWMKRFTPFGWSDLLNPVLGPKPAWIIPTVVFATIFTCLAIYAVGRRDLSSALIRQSDAARSRFLLLASPFAFALRRSSWTIVWWGVGTVFFAAFFAAVANLGSNLAEDSPAFKQVFSADAANDFKLAFLGAGTMFTAVIMLIMVTTMFSAVRREEARTYLDNLLVQPVHRTHWLLGRLALIAGTFTAISLLIGITVWSIANSEGIAVSLTSCLQGQISLMGIMLLVLGIGVCVYGFVPRLATAAMSIVIGWAFIFDILDVLFHLSDWMKKTSILTFIPSNPSKNPDWVALAWLVAIGVALIGVGVVRFRKRDIITE
jgi:ABC-2 type transport system permease protein